MTRKFLEQSRENFLKNKKESLMSQQEQLLPEPHEHIQKFKKQKRQPTEKERKLAFSKYLAGNFKARFVNMSLAPKNDTIAMVEQIYSCFLQSVSSNHLDQLKISDELNGEN